MNFTVETSVSALTVFLQGLLSFFSPCVLPLIPLYVSYLAGGFRTVDPDGAIRYPRKKILLNTLFFALGISVTFFILGLGFTALGQFFSSGRVWFARVSGILMILLGIYQFGVFGKPGFLEREHRLPFQLDRWVMGPLPAFLLGFTFSFAWTPCVGPTLGSVLLMAGSSNTAETGFALIGVYTLGFILPFLAVGLFTGAVLSFFKQHQGIVRYTVKIGAALLILMGILTLFGVLNGGTSSPPSSSDPGTQPSALTGDRTVPTTEPEAETKPTTDESEPVPAPDFTLVDQNGETHTLSDYQGKTVFLNFWATWCSPCRGEMPEIQALYEKYGSNQEDLIVLGVAGPNVGQEGSAEDIAAFLSENKYSFPVVMDEDGGVFAQYGIRAFPTTFLIDENGNLFGYIESALTGEIMEQIVQQTIESVS